MKKIISSIICLFITISMSAQLVILDKDDNVIQDNQTFTFGTTDIGTAKLSLHIQNNSSQIIRVKGEVISFSGTDGKNVKFCLGECPTFINVGTVVPEMGGYNIEPNETTDGIGTYFLNLDNSNNYIEYKFKIYQIDNSGNQVGNAITINYVYDANLSTSTEELAQMGVDIENTIASEEIRLQTSENIFASIYDLNGKKVFEKSLQNGNQSINISMLNAGVYLVRFNNQSGNTATAKIIKK
ncbi:T9SS type A sorting domain-containing protein [Mesonia aquimarina]|uniref:T9SS type A sorting domain-containing protein n=1 Tax=Mesonia aquimarina TaxID=1504967 RepID=UPI000EF616CC|nr:T9SS type A sorting domain-containing protein [Mesonia aquimarina]